ncbi:hypothetical protein, conserved [Trypanosoma brucei gambiense DAL972]|uniref:FYVE-type domain-containing protein n=2 Tax=Trypanosoma brucei TaxID=5691 RepID=C9ZSW1_TRYB9|nr:hypothetical protein, conserved [Trypanosoma brucei gambiense DAL972]RHW71668.1 ras-like small GTPase [Trypanosoma brucei equiperdum]CBH12496.1 hypothetical protein, conserved [Trypanosoma brucei gambiense DAL972]|eukprot:XP_011774776.1 hypothetical protein, conserved [Trypanosoma brucei gambiense DAL972]
MDHIDLAEEREMGNGDPIMVLNVSVPYSANSSDRKSNVSSPLLSKCASKQTSGVMWLTKPTLDPSCIRLCPLRRWVPDTQVSTCMAHGCNVAFSMFNRRHHCRVCGRVFCSACCSETVNALVQSALEVQSNPIEACGGVDKTSLPSGRVSGTDIANGEDNISQQQQQGQVQFMNPTTVAAYRVCFACHYEVQLVVSRRDRNGEVRRKCRGELKMLQWSLLVRVLSYLTMEELLGVSLVSSDFYFMSRDNVIWYRYNMTRCLREEELQRMLSTTLGSRNSTRRQRLPQKQLGELTFGTDFDSITSAGAAKPTISLNARYNFTQFLDFTRRREATRCKGLSCFSVGMRDLLSSPIKIALIGPCGVGKTSLMREWGRQRRPGDNSARFAATPPTVTFNQFDKTVFLTGGLTARAQLRVFDISGHPRFRELTRFVCASCHAVVICYDPQRKSSLMEAKAIIADVETKLGVQPVIVCGLIPPADAGRGGSAVEVSAEEATEISSRERGSLLCAWHEGKILFEHVVQCLLDCIALGTSAISFTAPVSPLGVPVDSEEFSVNRSTAQELLRITMCPSAIDVLLD